MGLAHSRNSEFENQRIKEQTTAIIQEYEERLKQMEIWQERRIEFIIKGYEKKVKDLENQLKWYTAENR